MWSLPIAAPINFSFATSNFIKSVSQSAVAPDPICPAVFNPVMFTDWKAFIASPFEGCVVDITELKWFMYVLILVSMSLNPWIALIWACNAGTVRLSERSPPQQTNRRPCDKHMSVLIWRWWHKARWGRSDCVHLNSMLCIESFWRSATDKTKVDTNSQVNKSWIELKCNC